MNSNTAHSGVILIGSVGAGKSTQAELLAQELGWPRYAMDELRWSYYSEIGYDEELAQNIREREGFKGVTQYWKPFEAHAVERLSTQMLPASGSAAVVDFGAGHSVFEDDLLFGRVRRALQPYPNVVLLLPSRDLDESIRILRTGKWDGRNAKDPSFDFHEHFVKHPSNRSLAKFEVYTEGQTPEQTRDAIMTLLNLRS